jgi:serine/threonine protein kinase
MGNIFKNQSCSIRELNKIEEKKINIFDTEISKWNLTTNTKYLNQRLTNYQKFLKLNVYDNCVCKPNEKKKSEGKKSILKKCILKVSKRIGSEGIAGYVFELKSSNKLKMAAKIIPNIIRTVDVINNETNIATYLSNLVITNQTVYFPIVYGVYKCDNTIYSSLNKLLNNNILIQIIGYHIFKTCSKKSVSDINKLNSKYKLLSTKQYLSNIKQVMKEHKKKISINDIIISSTILISEIAWGDLRQYIRKNRTNRTNRTNKTTGTEDQLIYLLQQIIKGIITLQQHNIIHNDLHTGNILIIISNNENELLPLIHDFGESVMISSEMTFNEKIIDINNLIYVLTEEIKHKKYLRLENFLLNISNIIITNKGNMDIMYIINDSS